MKFRVIESGFECWRGLLLLTLSTIILANSPTARAQSQACDLSEYREQGGLASELVGDSILINWDGAGGDKLRIRFTIEDGVPGIAELAIQAHDGKWDVVGRDLTPEFRVVSGIRRVTQQQTEPLEELGIPLTADLLDEIKWDAFWDAPLFVTNEPQDKRQGSVPASEPFANHPGMPRSSEEIVRATAVYHVSSCAVTTEGTRLEIVFHGVEAGIFSGYLEFSVFKGSNLIRQTLVAKTDHPSAAFKYDAGLTGLELSDRSRLVWRDLANRWQDFNFGTPAFDQPVVIRTANRLVSAEQPGGSIAVFPPPHSFYWARESEQNLGYSWYRKDNERSYSVGIRQAELEEDPEFYQNFALYSARPGTWQRMPVFFLVSRKSGEAVVESALAYTRDDRFKPISGFKVMGHHYHVGMVERLKAAGGLEQRLNDIQTMKGIGVDIFGVIDGARGPGRKDTGELFLHDLTEYYEAARRQSDSDFLVMPNDENSTGGRRPFLGGHYDILVPKPLYWRPARDVGQPLYEQHPEYGRVYNLGTPDDMMEMTELENALIAMPHPRSKGSTGYPDAIKNEPQFLHSRYFALGYRWGMGIDASEKRLGEYRFLTMWNEVNNWMTQRGLPPKFALAISEARSDKGLRGKPPWDDAYGMSPVNYIKLDAVPPIDDMSPIIDTLRRGEFFVTSGEILITSFAVEGGGQRGRVVADLEWTFPLDFVELVWGDGSTTDRQIVPIADLREFGSHRFEIPFDATGKKWIRLAAWDVAGNGALVQPVALGETGTAGRSNGY